MSNCVDDAPAPLPATAPQVPDASPAASPVFRSFSSTTSCPPPSVRCWAWLPVCFLPLAMLVLKASHYPGSFDSPYLRVALTFLFGSLVALIVVLFVGRSFLVRGQPALLLLNSGLLFFGLAGFVASIVGAHDVNRTVTIFNICAWFSAVCHLLSVVLLLRPWRPLPAPGLWLGASSLLVVVVTGLVALAAHAGWTPPFFLQGQGGTPVRQVILCSALIFFALSALLPRALSRQPLSAFLYWYSLALGLSATGLFGVMLQDSFGSPLSWAAWGTMCLAGLYMLMAALASVRESRAWGLSLEVALLQSEARFQALIQASFEGIALNEGGRVTDCNEQFLHLLGYRREEIIGREIAALIPPEDRARVLANIVQNREASLEHDVLRKDGTRLTVETHGKPLVYAGRQIRVTAIRDISQRKQAEHALQQAQASLQAHAEELEQVVARRTAGLHAAIAELEHFSYAITHDLRAPLRAMQGYAELLAGQCNCCSQPLNQEFLRRIQIAATRMDQLITDSLNYSKAARQQVPLQPVPLQDLLEGMIRTYPNLLPDQADIRLETDLPIVLGNQAALTQCFGNLLDNAVKFAKPNSKPQIRIRPQLSTDSSGAQRRPDSSGNSQLSTPLVRIWVEDNGIGIPQEMQARIFGLFERAHHEQQGTGLGLAIVRKLAHRMGGEVGVESTPGQGSRFWIELQLAPAN